MSVSSFARLETNVYTDLDANGSVGFIADQDAGHKGVFVDFFGRPASTYKAIALLAMRHGAPVVVGYGRRLGAEYKFEIGVNRIILPGEWADKDDPMTWITEGDSVQAAQVRTLCSKSRVRRRGPRS